MGLANNGSAAGEGPGTEYGIQRFEERLQALEAGTLRPAWLFCGALPECEENCISAARLLKTAMDAKEDRSALVAAAVVLKQKLDALISAAIKRLPPPSPPEPETKSDSDQANTE